MIRKTCAWMAVLVLLCVAGLGSYVRANPAYSGSITYIPTIAADSGNAGAIGHAMLGTPRDTLLAGGTLITNWMPCHNARYIMVQFRDSSTTSVYGDSLDEVGIQWTNDGSTTASPVVGAKMSMTAIATSAGTAVTCDTSRTQMYSINACLAGAITGSPLSTAASISGGMVNMWLEPQFSTSTARSTIGMRFFRLRFHAPVVRARQPNQGAVSTTNSPSVIGLKCVTTVVYDGPPPGEFKPWYR